jgi:UMF1 family MFS transporter
VTRPGLKAWLAARPALSWALYDWANSAFATTVMAGFFPVFFRQYWSAGADAAVTTGRLGFANSVAGLIIALLAPLLGAVADRGGRRKQMLFAFTLLGAASTFALFFQAEGQWLLAALLFTAGTIGFSGGVVFNDALLLDVAEPADYDRVSALGYALGYLGGGVLFAINVLMVTKPALFGLPDAAAAVRWAFVSVAAWWMLFTMPLLLFVREGPPRAGASGGALAAGWRELIATAMHVLQRPPLWQFLLAYWLYIDGVNTIIKMAVDYGMSLGLASTDLLGALLLTQFIAFPASLAFGWLGKRIGARAGVLLGLSVYVGITIWAYFLGSALEFYLMAATLGLVQGGVQSLSRSMYGRMVPEGKSALMGGVALLTGSTRLSILALLLLFVGGGLLLWRVRSGPAVHAAI